MSLDQVAYDELKHIFSFCDSQVILTCLKVCKMWNEFVRNIPVSIKLRNSEFNRVVKNLKTIKTHGINFNLIELDMNEFAGAELVLNELKKSSFSKSGTLKSLQLNDWRGETQGKRFKNSKILDECEELIQNLTSLGVGGRYWDLTDYLQRLVRNGNTKLKKLDLTRCEFGEIFELEVVKNLETLIVKDCNSRLVVPYPLVNLTELHMPMCGVSEIVIENNLPNLTKLNLSDNKLDDMSIVSLTSKETILPKLTDLDIGGAKFNHGLLEKLVKKFNLTRLVLFRAVASDHVCQMIAESENMSKLTSLNLGRSDSCSSDAVINLSKSSKLSLKRLILDGIEMNQEACEAISQSRVFNTLTDLSLSYCGITSKLAKCLANSPNLSNLKELQLKANQLGSEGCLYLATSPFITRLTYLNLCHNAFEDDICEILANSTAFERIIELDISGHEHVHNYEILQGNPNLPNLQILVAADEYHDDDYELFHRPHQVNNK